MLPYCLNLYLSVVDRWRSARSAIKAVKQRTNRTLHGSGLHHVDIQYTILRKLLHAHAPENDM